MPKFKFQNINIAYEDRGQGEPLIIVHGTPTNSSEYKSVIDQMAGSYRCIAIDHLGFGDSDKPEDADYSITAHQARLNGLLEHLGISGGHLLLHDFGSVIGSAIALNSLDTEDRGFSLKSVTILNSWLWPLVETEPKLKSQAWAVSYGLLPFLYRYFNFSAKILLKLAWGRKSQLTKETHDRYIMQFPTPKERSGPIGFLRELFNFTNPQWQTFRKLDRLENIPVLIVWGKADKLLSAATLERWKVEVPHSEIHLLEDVGHFVAEEAPDELVSLMKDFLKRQVASR